MRRLPPLGPGPAELWLKDDGAFSPFGGNKARKLEWLLADARRRGKQTILTGGALGTNHGLSTALCARELGMRTVLVLVPQAEDEHVRRQFARIRDAGAEIHLARRPATAYAIAASLLLRRAGPRLRLPYFLLPGGSVPLGCVGYVEAGLELGRQVAAGEIPEPSHAVVALGTGGTAAGLLLGLRLAALRTRVVCVLVNDLTTVNARTVSHLARRTDRLLRRHGAELPAVSFDAADLQVERGWLGEGYGQATAEGERAIALFRERAGVELEPVYTAKAGAAVLALNERAAFGEGPVLFWHTYGGPGAPPGGTS